MSQSTSLALPQFVYRCTRPNLELFWNFSRVSGTFFEKPKFEKELEEDEELEDEEPEPDRVLFLGKWI